MKTASIDFETYYDSKEYTLKKMTPWAYVQDKRFDPYLVSIKGGDVHYVGPPKEFNWLQLSGYILVAHNMGFDGMVLRRCIELGWIPDFERTEYCTADLMVYLGYPRNLLGAVKHAYGRDLDKSMRAEMEGRTLSDTVRDGDYNKLIQYADIDAVECLQLWTDFSPQWPLWEREASRLNREACWRGVAEDVEAIKASAAALEQRNVDAENALPWVNPQNPDEKPRAAGSGIAFGEFLAANGITPLGSYKKDCDEMLQLIEDTMDNPIVAPVVQAWLDHSSLVQHLSRLRTQLATMDAEGIIRFAIKYGGCHTLRTSSGSEESGASIFNPLNIPKEPVFSVDLRGTLIPRKGHKFLVFDFCQIEARVILWLARHTTMLERIRENGGNLYIAFAVLAGFVKLEDVDTPAKIKAFKTTLMYAIVKAVVLAHGFGMGSKKFRTDTFRKSKGKIRLSEEEALHWTTTWREKNQPVCNFWTRMGNGLTRSALMKEETFSVKMPSGRVKTYYKPHRKLVPKTFIDPLTKEKKSVIKEQLFASLTRGGHPRALWGGIVAQHVTQSTARDIMTESAVEVCTLHPSWPWLWSCYDEVVFEVPDAEAEYAKVEIERILTQGTVAQTWAKGLPLEVEAVHGGILDRYCK